MNDMYLVVECKDGSEFDELVTGREYFITEEDIGENSYNIDGKWYGQSNFKVKAS